VARSHHQVYFLFDLVDGLDFSEISISAQVTAG
jgi:hypothetical protein